MYGNISARSFQSLTVFVIMRVPLVVEKIGSEFHPRVCVSHYLLHGSYEYGIRTSLWTCTYQLTVKGTATCPAAVG